jgi:hypothetical protein
MVKDKCWYKQESVVCLIEKPVNLSGSKYLKVDDDKWRSVMK